MESPDNPFDFDAWLEETAIPPEEPAEFLARRVLGEHSLTPPLGFAELWNVATARGVPVFVIPELDEAGLCSRWDDVMDPVILVQSYDPYTLAHEMYHALVRDNARRGIIYRRHMFADTPIEDAANLFAWILTHEPGEWPINCHRGDWDEPGAEEWHEED